MSQHTLSNVTLQTIKNYRHAAELTVKAYRVGSHRLIDVIDQRLAAAGTGRAAKIAPKATQVLTGVRGRVTKVAAKGVDSLSGRTDQAIAFSADGVAAQVKRLAELAGGVDNRYVADGLQAAARLSLPGAEVALALSARVAEGADMLSTAVAGRRTIAAKAKTVTRKATVKTRAKAKATTAVKAVKAVKSAKVVKAVKATRRAAPAKRAVSATRTTRAAKTAAAAVSA